MKKILTAALLAGGLIMATATAASAHTSSVTHDEVCTDEGATKTVVTFDNDFALTAIVSYHWGTASGSTVALAAKQADSSNPKVSLPSHDVGTLTYHVTWSDDYRQPTTGDTTLTIGPLTGCHDTTTSSSTSSTSTSSTSTTSTSTTTTTQPTITEIVQPTVAEQAAVVPTEVLGVQLTAPAPAPAPALAPAAAPAPVGGVQTGGGGTSQSGNPLLPFGAGLACIGLVLVAQRLRRPVLS